MTNTRKSTKTAQVPSTGHLEDLVVFDKLTLGPVKLERNKIVAPYTVSRQGAETSTDLIYRYGEDVFDPEDPVSQNIASLTAAQVALNYGLFCREIEFIGSFHSFDERFLRDMAENTAREIYVKKFLEPNPFLLGSTANMEVTKRKKYCYADLRFSDTSRDKAAPKWEMWPTDPGKACVLSSGGKDSLLSYGLLNEIGLDVHPVFINESGRHWFTALNAYRYFSGNVANTSRVWVNSDRVFSWMLRQMPFIRGDFASVRADEYPIRLWTVAVFLFGAIPILRKRGIGRLIIGDEHDTTNKASHQGITHYDGLYDQSRYFDETLSRFYLQKGWSISQFSILRQMSEILIEKTLAERYPRLLELQTSCHSAHKRDGRVYPCGKCEKCRRIVGMLIALDQDPRKCGYTDSQIESCLKAIAAKGVHQEAPGHEHMTCVLLEKKRIDLPDDSKQKAREHPVIMMLRFSRERSRINGMPIDIRRPLFEILSEHSDGAVKRMRRKWVDFDPLTDPSIEDAYPFEMPTDSTTASSSPTPDSPRNYLWAELTWPEAGRRLEEVDVALLPVGSTEQHGPHLPLDTDAFDAYYLATRVAEACGDPKPLVLPPVHYGVSYHHDDFPGTLSISNDTLAQLVYEIGMSAVKNGIKKLVILNGHGDNAPTLSYAAQMINRDSHIFTCVESGESSDVDLYALSETPNDVHAGEIETSTTLAVRPNLVRMGTAKAYIPKFSSRYLDFSSRRSVPWYAYTKKISKSGVMGDPTKATAKKGQRMWKIMIAHLVAFVEDLRHMSLDEIYQRRY